MALKRREFLKTAGATTAAALISRHLCAAETLDHGDVALHFVSDSMELQLSDIAPEFLSLNIDGLGKGKRGANIVVTNGTASGFKASTSVSGGVRRVEYRSAAASKNSPAAWTIEFTNSRIDLTSEWSANAESVPMAFHFNLEQVHSTVLGVFRKDKLLAIPALMHFPGQGSLRLTANVGEIGLTYHSVHGKAIASLSLPGATSENQRVVFTLEVTTIYPKVPGIDGNMGFDAFRRNWLDTLQLNPEYPALANNTASDTCAFCYYEYADIAALTPPLAEGLTALDIVRQTLDRMLAGGERMGYPRLPGPPTTLRFLTPFHR